MFFFIENIFENSWWLVVNGIHLQPQKQNNCFAK